MNLFLNLFAGVVVFTAGPLTANSADYADLSTDDLVQMRSGAQAMATEDRDSYRSEMQNRMQSMLSLCHPDWSEAYFMSSRPERSVLHVIPTGAKRTSCHPDRGEAYFMSSRPGRSVMEGSGEPGVRGLRSLLPLSLQSR